VSLKAVVDDYIRRYRDDSESELEWFRSQPTLEAALDVAARAIGRDGSKYSHQYRIIPEAIKAAQRQLSGNVERIRKAPNFAILLREITAVLGKIAGLGDLYYYDAALRVGAKLGLYPEQIYLHAGTRAGAAVLGLNANQRFLYVSDMPQEFRELAPHEIEDVLCIYADKLKDARAGDFTPPDFVWCYPGEAEE
jgi:hypothetical protein